MSKSRSAPASRELAVSVTAVFDLAYIEAMYVEALTPDGGWSGTLNRYIEEFADVRGLMNDCTYESGWKLRALFLGGCAQPANTRRGNMSARYEYEWVVLLKWLRPRAVWTNKHTGEETTITNFASRIERVPDADSLGFRDEPELVVHHTANVPPGFRSGYGEDALSFIEHWHPSVMVALATERSTDVHHICRNKRRIEPTHLMALPDAAHGRLGEEQG